ncbi:CoxG family protein [Candidatus Hecatella orcuttiae]|jgi:hypothetical protein|uniref:CoxG family protein n=1 Tax=Candidatus Hecatella orcuttiae TaxID=1935119 RepID=UPI002867D7D5|nr:SRPBCC domain-containing protein [Candidatus Hecatella orcuttiae]
MPEAEATFTIKAPLDRVWSFLVDPRRLGSCFPDVQEVRVLDEKTAEWVLKVKLGFIRKTIKMKSTVTDFVPQKRVTFQGVAEEAELSGTMNLESGPGEVKIHYKILMEGRGPLAPLMNDLIRRRISKQSQEFIEILQKKLEV